MNKYVLNVGLLLLVIFSANILASEDLLLSNQSNDVIERRMQQEMPQNNTSFLISLYKPSYLLPFFYIDPIFAPGFNSNKNSKDDKNHKEAKFQISFKFPIWRNIFNDRTTLFAAYTQQSNWQVYTGSPYFRETNYEPELFLANKVDYELFKNVKLKFLNLGVVHQSNGRGGDYERSWNRIYVEAIAADGNWMVSLKPWYILQDASVRLHNANIANYLGYDRLLISYKQGRQTFSVEKSNLEKGFNRGAIQATWSFPLNKKVKGYIQYFNGYGQSLIDYNKRTHSVGIGIALNDWV